MSRDYKMESIRRFPLKAMPFEDDYAKEADYQQDYAEYKVEHNATMACRQEWIDEEKEADHRAEEAAEAKKKAEEAAEVKQRKSVRGKSAMGSSRSKGEGSGKGKQRVEVEVKGVAGVGEVLPDSEWCRWCILQGMVSVFCVGVLFLLTPLLDISCHSMPWGYLCGACQMSKLKCKWPPGSRMAHTHSESLEVMWELIKSQENMTRTLDCLNSNLEHVRISVEQADNFSDSKMREDVDSVEEQVEVEEEFEEDKEDETVVPSGSSHYKKRKLK